MKTRYEIKKEMLKEGWLPSEINGMLNAKTPSGQTQKLPDIDSPVYLAMRRSRMRYVADLTRLGWTRDEIMWKLVQYHKGKKNDPFAFLKAEYRQKPKLKDFQGAVALRISKRAIKGARPSVEQRRIDERKSLTRGLGYSYGRKLKRVVVQRRAPARPNLMIRRRVIRNEGQN